MTITAFEKSAFFNFPATFIAIDNNIKQPLTANNVFDALSTEFPLNLFNNAIADSKTTISNITTVILLIADHSTPFITFNAIDSINNDPLISSNTLDKFFKYTVCLVSKCLDISVIANNIPLKAVNKSVIATTADHILSGCNLDNLATDLVTVEIDNTIVPIINNICPKFGKFIPDNLSDIL